MVETVTSYLCGEAIGYIRDLIRRGRIADELRRRIEILIDRNSFLESDLSRLTAELLAEKSALAAEKSLSLKREEARAGAREAQLQGEKELIELRRQLADQQEWKKTREKYQPDERTGLQKRKDTGGCYCPKCLYSEPPVEQPVPPAPDYERCVKCPVCGGDLPNPYWRPPSGDRRGAFDDIALH